MEVDRHQKLQELYRDRKQLVELREHPGWVQIQGLLQQQCRLRRMTVFSTQIAGESDCFALARAQGEVAGLQFVGSLVEVVIADFDATINTMLTEMREEESDEHDTNGTPSGGPGTGDPVF